MKDEIDQLKGSIFAKCMELTSICDFDRLKVAVGIIADLETIGGILTASPTGPAATIDSVIEMIGFPPHHQSYIDQEWLSTSEASKFSGWGEDMIRDLCEKKKIFSRTDPAKKRKTWQVCPKSLGVLLHELKDPRLK